MASRSRRGSWAAVGSGTAREDGRTVPVAARVARALAAHEHRTAAGLLGLFVLAYLWPVLVGGRTLAPTGLLFAQTPWAAGAPPVLHWFNGDLADVPATYYPWAALVRDLLRHGTFPAWNPYALAGTPLFANSQIAWLSPFSWVAWLLPLNYGLGVAAALKLWLAGFGAYLLVRELRLGFWPALLGGVGYALCAFNVVWLTYGVFVSVSALLPWAIWLVERIVRRGRPRDALALVAVVALVQSGGHPGTQLHVLSALALYALVRVLLPLPGDGAARLRALGLVGAAVGLGTLLLAVVLLPAQQASLGTYGALVRQHGGSGMQGAHVPLGALRSALFPDWWGRPSEQVFGGGSHYRERTFYAGAVQLVLAALALVSPGAWRRKAPFALLAALGAAVALKAPLVFPLVARVPLLDAVQDQRMLLLFQFGVIVLAAFGLRAALDTPRSRRLWLVLAAAALAAPLAALFAGGAGVTLADVAHEVIRRSGADVQTVAAGTRALASVVWWLVFVLALALALWLARARPRRARLAAALVVLVAALDLLHFAHGYNPMGPPSAVIPPRTPAIAYLQAHRAGMRIAGLGQAMEADWSTMYGLPDVRGHDAPQPSLRFAHLWLALDTTEPGEVSRFGRPAVNVLGLLGARLLLAAPDVSLRRPEVALAYSGPDAAIYENRLAVPRAFVAPAVRVAGSEDAELNAVFAHGFDPRRTAVVGRDGLAAGAAPSGAAGAARVVAEGNAHVDVRAQLARPGLVVLDDALAPGWSVRVDGRPARAIPTDVVLRGVRVPAGRHEIVWSYRVPGLRLGAALTAAALLLTLAWALALAQLRARQPGSASSSAAGIGRPSR